VIWTSLVNGRRFTTSNSLLFRLRLERRWIIAGLKPAGGRRKPR
jgi:hypothetical protein